MHQSNIVGLTSDERARSRRRVAIFRLGVRHWLDKLEIQYLCTEYSVLWKPLSWGLFKSDLPITLYEMSTLVP